MFNLPHETLTGAGALGIPAILLAIFLLWRVTRIVFWLAIVLLIVGLGYLASTGALDDVGRAVGSTVFGTTPATAPN